MDTFSSTPVVRELAVPFGIRLYRYRSLIRRHWWIAALTVGLALAFQTWRLFETPIVYESSSELRVREELTRSQDKFRVDTVDDDTLKLLASSELRNAAKRRLAAEAPALSGEVDIIPSVAPKTSIVSIVGTGTNPEETRRFVDAVVSEFIALRRNERSSVQSQAYTDITSELQNVRKDLDWRRRQFQAFVQKNDMDVWQKTSESSAGYLANLQTEQAQLQNELQKLKSGTSTGQNAEIAAGKITAIEAKLKGMEVAIERWKDKVQEAGKMEGEYKRLQAALQRTEDQQDKLLAALATLPSNTGSSSGIPMVVRPASAPFPVAKGIGKQVILGVLAGLFLAGAILFLMDRSDDRIASSSEMFEHFSEPVLAQIPNVGETRTEAGLPLMESEDERYSYAEAFRSLRASLIFMPHQTEFKTLAITSAIPNEGKSTIASNLGITMAASGARVLLVDADLRRGDLAALFDTDNGIGLSHILRDEVSWKSTVRKTAHDTLWLIPSGSVPNQADELLLRPILQTMIDELEADYDLIIFNTPPILTSDETPALAAHFDGTLMVVRAEFTSARLTQKALKALDQRQARVLGLILNCVDIETPDYYYYRYPKYYAA